MSIIDRTAQRFPFRRPDRPRGCYETVDGAIKKFDDISRVAVLTDGMRIPIGEIYEIESDLLRPLL